MDFKTQKQEPIIPLKVWLTILGIGEGGLDELGQSAQNALEKAEYIFGGKRHLAHIKGKYQAEFHIWSRPFLDSIEKLQNLRNKNVVILASGDPMHYGVGVTLHRYFLKEEMLVLPYVSSFSLAAARLGWALQDVSCLSIHARDPKKIIPFLKDKRKLLILAHDKHSPLCIKKLLDENFLKESIIYVLENLGGNEERLISWQDTLENKEEFSDLNLIAVECRATQEEELNKKNKHINGQFLKKEKQTRVPYYCLPDDFFVHDGQITKQNIRSLTMTHLAPREGELLWDIGAGCGSISIEWVRTGKGKTRAIAIEKNKKRAEFIAQNAIYVDNASLTILNACAEDVLCDLELPDAIFIGGGFTYKNLAEISWNRLKKRGRLIANAVTIETEHAFFEFVKKHGGRLIRMQTSELDPIGNFHTWRSALPITILIAIKE